MDVMLWIWLDMTKIICFGDSNTFGFNPQDGSRYDKNSRWTGLLSTILGESFVVVEEGCNNRTGFFLNSGGEIQSGQKYLPKCLEKHRDFDVFVFALGTNDLQKFFDIDENIIINGLKNATSLIKKINPDAKIIIIPPVVLRNEILTGAFAFQFDENSIKTSIQAQKIYSDFVQKEKIELLDLNKFVSPSILDGLHFSRESHEIIAEQVAKKVLSIVDSNIEVKVK
jgi:lysophospholipase L1-like esterase